MHCVCMVQILYHAIVTSTHLCPTPHSVISHGTLKLTTAQIHAPQKLANTENQVPYSVALLQAQAEACATFLTSVLGSSEPHAWLPGLPLGLVSAPTPPLSFSSGRICAQFSTLQRSESLVSAQTLGKPFPAISVDERES